MTDTGDCGCVLADEDIGSCYCVLEPLVQAVGRRHALAVLNVIAARETAHFNEIQEQLAESVWTAGCSNWYVTESGKVVNNWPGLSSQYDRLTRELDPDDYRMAGAR